jgi:hypothetical protein
MIPMIQALPMVSTIQAIRTIQAIQAIQAIQTIQTIQPVQTTQTIQTIQIILLCHRPVQDDALMFTVLRLATSLSASGSFVGLGKQLPIAFYSACFLSPFTPSAIIMTFDKLAVKCLLYARRFVMFGHFDIRKSGRS